MRLLKRWHWPCSSWRRSLTRGTFSSTVPAPTVALAVLPVLVAAGAAVSCAPEAVAHDDAELATQFPAGQTMRAEAVPYQVSPFTISGVVEFIPRDPRLEHRRSVAGIAIKVIDENGNTLAEALTGESGKYQVSL